MSTPKRKTTNAMTYQDFSALTGTAEEWFASFTSGPPQTVREHRDTQDAAYWRGNAAAFRAVAGMKSTVPAGMRKWAESQAQLADAAAYREEGKA